LANGNLGDSNGFWALYAPNLNVNDLLRPLGGDSNLIVNSSDTQTFASGTRARNNWTTSNIFYNMNDPTMSTAENDYISCWFDKETGILTALTNVQQYNNPQMNLIIIWQMTNSTEWAVS
jgi:hypothetical protein